ncbi:MAG: DUF3488 and transglutaminase-like domain-containing protein [Proteobacteria bacterium]|nr:DUF3488 and transglutaminase-like domain-containing protein [Pseudomonadota bacterium]
MKIVLTDDNHLSIKQIFWIISSVVIAVLPHLPRLPVWFGLLLIIVVAITWFAAKGSIKVIPRWLIAVATILTFLAIIYFQGFALNREISVTILTTMTVLKLLETRAKRDAWMVVTLCYFVILTRFFYSQDLLLVLYLIASVIVITHSLFILQHDNSNKLLRKHEIKQTLSLLLYGVPLAALFFLFFPRLGSPIWGSPDLFGQGKTGISEQMSPGSISSLFNDDSTAFRATFNGAIPAKSQLYWRGPVLWDFDGKTWHKNQQLQATIRPRNFALEGQIVNYEIELEPTGQKYIFALDYMLSTPNKTFLLSDSQLMSNHDLNQLSHYQFSSVLKTYNPYEWLPQSTLKRLTQLPANFNPKTIKMMQSWRQQTSNPEHLIQRVLNLFTTDEFYYSYTPPLLSNHTVDQFLFTTKSGFCEHYASAFTVMMRAADIPARVVTGYQGGIRNGDYLLVKQSDAHAWSEVWIADKGWLRVDPTAAVSPLRVEQGSQALMSQQSRSWHDTSWLRKAGERYDAMRHKWNKWVRDYDVLKQRALFKIVGFDSQDGKSIAIILGVIMLGTTLVVLFLLYIFKPKRKFNHYDKVYHKFLKIFKSKGLVKSPQQGTLAFAHVATAKFPQAKQSINEFVALYLKLRYAQSSKNNTVLDKRLNKIIAKIYQSMS